VLSTYKPVEPQTVQQEKLTSYAKLKKQVYQEKEEETYLFVGSQQQSLVQQKQLQQLRKDPSSKPFHRKIPKNTRLIIKDPS